MSVKSSLKTLSAVIIALVSIMLIIMVGPLDTFTHGVYFDTIDIKNINKEDFIDKVDLTSAYRGKFVPQKEHFDALGLYLVDLPTKNRKGTLSISIYDANGEDIYVSSVPLDRIKPNKYYWVMVDTKLKTGVEYSYTIEINGCNKPPYLWIVDDDYLGTENVGIGCGVLMGYAYAEPTFSFSEKVLIIVFILALGMACISYLIGACKALMMPALVLAMTALLSWNYAFDSFNGANDSFSKFQSDSETLVSGMIWGERDHLPLPKYGLGRYSDYRGVLKSYNVKLVNNANWRFGFSLKSPMICISNTGHNKNISSKGHSIQFKNGDVFKIVNQKIEKDYIHITLDNKEPLNYYKYGDLLEAVFYDENMKPLNGSTLSKYDSQYGLQGYVFRHMAHLISSHNAFEVMNLLCCLLTASIFVLIVLLLKQKYSLLMAVVFYGVFLLSPWIVNFARNLYWVEFTWFTPVLIGLFCSYHVDNTKCRIISYIGVVISIFIKCLCGYEYVTTIMLGMVAFLTSDFVLAVINNDKKRSTLILRTIFFIGLCALAGFALAICMHAKTMGNGNVVVGLKIIFKEDVIRRTLGGNINDFDKKLWPSINSSIWYVVCKYFHFKTKVIAGISGETFPMLCIIPILLFMHDLKKNRLNKEEVVLYTVFFLVTTSWFVLGKSHSYVHGHMNYVLWYFGYVQICIYVICNHIRNFQLEWSFKNGFINIQHRVESRK